MNKVQVRVLRPLTYRGSEFPIGSEQCLELFPQQVQWLQAAGTIDVLGLEEAQPLTTLDELFFDERGEV